MGVEIERKYLVAGDGWRSLAEGTLYRQGYLSTVKERTVRVRVVGDRAQLTIKGVTVGATRVEYEYTIPLEDAEHMLDELCEQPIIDKVRYEIPGDDVVWEIDEFHGVNEGLVVAEVELESEDQLVALPEWVGAEVTDDPRYFNANLIAHPFSDW